jgi:hypothetical protein
MLTVHAQSNCYSPASLASPYQFHRNFLLVVSKPQWLQSLSDRVHWAHLFRNVIGILPEHPLLAGNPLDFNTRQGPSLI